MIIHDISQAKYGDIILFEPTSLRGHIQVFVDNLWRKEKYNVSHVAMFWSHDGNTPLMFESVSPCGSHIAKVQNWRNYTIVRLEGYKVVPKAEIARLLNKKYDYSKLWAVFANKFFGIPLVTDDDEQTMCAETINLAYYYAICPKGKCTPVTLASKIL
jgi:hypothetical protein